MSFKYSNIQSTIFNPCILETEKKEYIFTTYSTCFDQGGGSLMVMNTQFVRIVHIINMPNNVGFSQGK